MSAKSNRPAAASHGTRASTCLAPIPSPCTPTKYSHSPSCSTPADQLSTPRVPGTRACWYVQAWRSCRVVSCVLCCVGGVSIVVRWKLVDGLVGYVVVV
jgi:hypothetical protein